MCTTARASPSALAGLQMGHMSRHQGWLLTTAGSRLEAVAYLADALATGIAGPGADSPELLETLLDIGNSSLTYRTRYLRAPELLPVLHLLVLDQRNPLSLSARLFDLRDALARLPQDPVIASLLEAVPVPAESEADWLELLAGDPDHARIVSALRALAARMPELADAMTAAYFAQTHYMGMAMVTS